jgi:hypothetical protein
MTFRKLMPVFALLLAVGFVALRLTSSSSPEVRAFAPAQAVATSEATTARARAAATAAEAATATSGAPASATSPGDGAKVGGSSGAATTAPAGAPGAAPSPAPGSAGSTAAAAGASAPLPPAPGAADSGLRDRTGGRGEAIARQLNKELMPLASECIEQALARSPALEGLLALDLSLAPTEGGKALVESVVESPNNQIHDAELVECLRQSSFALEGLESSYSFQLSMPIKPIKPGKS